MGLLLTNALSRTRGTMPLALPPPTKKNVAFFSDRCSLRLLKHVWVWSRTKRKCFFAQTQWIAPNSGSGSFSQTQCPCSTQAATSSNTVFVNKRTTPNRFRTPRVAANVTTSRRRQDVTWSTVLRSSPLSCCFHMFSGETKSPNMNG